MSDQGIKCQHRRQPGRPLSLGAASLRARSRQASSPSQVGRPGVRARTSLGRLATRWPKVSLMSNTCRPPIVVASDQRAPDNNEQVNRRIRLIASESAVCLAGLARMMAAVVCAQARPQMTGAKRLLECAQTHPSAWQASRAEPDGRMDGQATQWSGCYLVASRPAVLTGKRACKATLIKTAKSRSQVNFLHGRLITFRSSSSLASGFVAAVTASSAGLATIVADIRMGSGCAHPAGQMSWPAPAGLQLMAC